MSLSVGIRNAIWYGAIIVSAFVLSIIQYCYSKKNAYGCCIQVAILSLITFFALSIVTYCIQYITNNIIFASGSIYFVPYLFLVSVVLNKRLRIPFLVSLDHTAIANVLARAVTITGCSFAGCCQGYPVSWGIYSAYRNETAVPMRMIEQLILIGVWWGMHRYYKNNNCETRGRCAAISMVLFGIINVVVDIFTIEKKLFYMTSIEGIFAFLTMCIGLFMLYYLDKKNPRID